ncbi:MAG TPA: polyprenyl synthetase family protein [Thermomicrobiales bacterium]|mgnify:CR=1 FL=1
MVKSPQSLLPDVDAIIEPYLHEAVAELDGDAPLLAGMARYHMGWLTPDLQPADERATVRGKRIRPTIAILSCAAVGGDPKRAAPLAAAIELLHNFTLVHDDIQDESPTRRHRPTVWSLWGSSQAINAGDALFACSHLALYRLREQGVPESLTLRLAAEFDRTTLAIVRGQVLDLQFEGRGDITPEQYHTMIAGKTADIVRYAAWAGALAGGADEDVAYRFAEFGLALGLGFQVRDDLLGIWGTTAETGKAEADDIRRRKQTLPILLLRERASEAEREELSALFSEAEVSPAGIARVLDLLEKHGIRFIVEAEITAFHDRAKDALLAATGDGPNEARDGLLRLVEFLVTRRH